MKFYPSLKKMKFALIAAACLGMVHQKSFAYPKQLRVLFLGNDFIETNNLTNVLSKIVETTGDTLVVDFNTPRMYSLQQHSEDAISLGKISAGTWNYVVLQEDGTRPGLSDAYVAANVTPYVSKLDSIVHKLNKCGRSVIFQTWAYRDGDRVNCTTFPPVCTYSGMDSMLKIRYNDMFLANNALLAPVGDAFNELKAIFPAINLYDADGITPSAAGSYLAAVTLYTILFGNNPHLIKYDFSVSPGEAALIRDVVAATIYINLHKYSVGFFNPVAGFTTSSIVGNTASFSSASSINVANYAWDFGDGGTSAMPNPSHIYSAPGTYNVRLIGDDCLLKDTAYGTVTIVPSGSVRESTLLNSITIYPNPARTVINIQSALNLKHVSFAVSNVLGGIVFATTDRGIRSINIENLAPGIYFLHLKDEMTGDRTVQKFVKE